MAKVTYASLKLKPVVETIPFKFKDSDIEILKYLPVEDKVDLVDITLQKAEKDGVYDSILLDMYFHLHLVYMYTNISFTEKQKEDEFKVYNSLKSNGFFDEFFQHFPEAEYNELLATMEDTIEMRLSYKNTAGAVLQTIIQDLPRNAQAAAEIVESFDKSKYQAVIDFASAANGGRNIKTNMSTEL